MADEIIKKVKVYPDGEVEVKKMKPKKFWVSFEVSGSVVFGMSYQIEKNVNNLTDEEIIGYINGFLDEVCVQKGVSLGYYIVIQDSDPIDISFYGHPNMNYYFNNKCVLNITWMDVNKKIITSKEDEIKENIMFKKITLLLPEYYEFTKYLIYKDSNLQATRGPSDDTYFKGQKDNVIVEKIIELYKNLLYDNKGIKDYDLKWDLKDFPDSEIIEYKCPLDSKTEPEEDPIVKNDNPEIKKFHIEGIPTSIRVKVNENLPDFSVWIGEKVTEEVGIEDVMDGVDVESLESKFEGDPETALEYELSETYDPESDANASQILAGGIINPREFKFDYIKEPVNGVQNVNIHRKPVSVSIAGMVLAMLEDAKKEGINIIVNSGTRPSHYSLDTKSESGVVIKAQSQQELYDLFLAEKGNLAAEPGHSAHEKGISVDLSTGSRKKQHLNTNIYIWLIKNSWRYGFVRTCKSEEWHFSYRPDISPNGPYAFLDPNNTKDKNKLLFFSDLGLDNLTVESKESIV